MILAGMGMGSTWKRYKNLGRINPFTKLYLSVQEGEYVSYILSWFCISEWRVVNLAFKRSVMVTGILIPRYAHVF